MVSPKEHADGVVVYNKYTVDWHGHSANHTTYSVGHQQLPGSTMRLSKYGDGTGGFPQVQTCARAWLIHTSGYYYYGSFDGNGERWDVTGHYLAKRLSILEVGRVSPAKL